MSQQCKQVSAFFYEGWRLQLTRGITLSFLILPLLGCQHLGFLEKDPHVNNRLKKPERALQIERKLKNVNARDEYIKDLLAHVEMAWQSEDFDRLEKLYTQLDAYDPGNLRAKEGFMRIEAAKKHQQFVDEAEKLIADGDSQLAMKKLHGVIIENPKHDKARVLYSRLLKEQEEKRKDKLTQKLVYNDPVTMEFKDVSIKSIFQALSKTTNINFILDKGVPANQKATIFVKSMAFRDAFDLLLRTNKLDKKIIGENSVIIYVNNKLNKREYEDLIVRSFVLDYADAKQLSGVLRSMLGINKVEIDERLNTLMIKDTAEVISLAEKIILAQDLPDAEVMLEVQVLEMRRSYVQNLGVNAPTGVSMPVPSSGILTIDDLKIKGGELVVNGVPGIEFNATEGNVSLLANPRIRVKNKELAKIHIGEKVPVFTSNVASTGVTSQTVQYIDAGLKLEIEPEISPTDDITIKLSLNVSSIGDEVTATTGSNQSVAFRVGTRLTSTILRLHDGETQVLAGLIDDQDRKNINGFPGLSKIPLLGRLFSTQSDDKIKTEIVLSITPHIVRDRRLPDANQAEMWVGSESQVGRGTRSPMFKKGASPFIVPKPANNPTPKTEKPKNINIPLPSGFSLGDGLSGGVGTGGNANDEERP